MTNMEEEDEMVDGSTVPSQLISTIQEAGVPSLLQAIRPQWQAKNLIERVRRLLPVDPSSACQRLFNAAIHDLKEKIVLAGIDLASEAAKQAQPSLPPVNKPEDVENYSTSNTIDLAFRIGLLKRADWRRISRCYEIRRDLEHEDDEYEAGPEDCIYVFKTCIEAVLSVDPIQPLKVKDVKEIVEQAQPIAPAAELLHDYSQAPISRKEEIMKFIMSISLDTTHSEIVQQNSFLMLSHLASQTPTEVLLTLAKQLQNRVTGRKLDRREVRVAFATRVLPYLRKAQLADFYEGIWTEFDVVPTGWRAFAKHGELLRSLSEVGGLRFVPAATRKKFVRWFSLCYLGEPGGVTSWGNTRPVYYSDSAEPLILAMIKEAHELVAEDLRSIAKEAKVKAKLENHHIARRWENLLDHLKL